MGRKKSRKVGQIGIPKSTTPTAKTSSGRPKKTSGNKPGTRQKVAEASDLARQKSRKDPRIGSKTPVDLMRHLNLKPEKEAKVMTFKTPSAELEYIENDSKLQRLLDKQENASLSFIEKAYVEQTLSRHKELCDMLGIMADEDEFEKEVDPLASFEAISIDDYKD